MTPNTKTELYEMWRNLPRPARMLIAFATIILGVKYLPIDAIAVLFFWVVLVGGVLFFMVGALTEDSYNALRDFIDELRKQSKEKAQSLKETVAEIQETQPAQEGQQDA